MTYTKYLLFSILVVCPSVLSAQGITRRIHQIDEVTVWGKRPMKEIGVQKTKFDSLALKENIALSMADILTFNSSVFVKSYGRATLSTVAFRGTSPSHTQVTWNGMRINNPMLGMTDFSTIPSYFIDQASLLHGTSSVNETGGGLGGLVKLGTAPEVAEGFNAQYVQGIGSFKTFDEFARFTYGSERWHVSTRAVYSSSPNDYKYTNHDKKINIYDEDKNIVGQYHPKERNRSGAFKDLHLLQEVYYNTGKGDRFGLNAWYINSNRELPMLTTDYGDATDFENRQREQTFRSVLSWDHMKSNWKLGVKGGYIHTWMAYDYKREVAREEMYGSDWIPLIPAFFIDGIISPKGNVMLKASISRNYRFPTLNDLYFLPGGNPNLKNEQGFSYDAGVSFDVGKKGIYKLSGGANWFDSYIDDWIIWLPTTKGFFSPRNVKKVHAYGVEVKANFAVQPAKDWLIDLNGSYSWTPSINEGEKMSPADQSVGKQLPYVPKHSASLTGRLSWRTWAFLYKWAFYSERYTMSSNDYTLTGHLPEYFMSNVSLEKNLFFKPVDIQLKFAVNNLFNEDYLSVLSRPMPGINFEFFIGITPKFGKNKKKSENTNM